MLKSRTRLIEICLCILFFCIILALFYRFSIQNTNRIQMQNRAYAEDAAKLLAVHLDDQFKSAQQVVDAFAFFLDKTLKSPDVPTKALSLMEEVSPFDAIRFTTPDGISHTSDGQTTDVKDRKFYREGMKGDRGMLIINSRVFHEPVLNFYAPVKFDGKIIGVLHGARKSRTFLRQLLEASYFGEAANVYLCRPDGAVLAFSHEPVTGNIVTSLIDEHIIEPDMREEILRVMGEGKSASFISHVENGANISIVKLPQFDYTLVQVFPASVSLSMIKAANKAGVELELSLLALFGIATGLLILRATWQKKALEARNRDLGMITRGMNILFSGRYLLGNLDTGECKYVSETDAGRGNEHIMAYSERLAAQLEKMPRIKNRDEFEALFNLDSLRKEFQTHKTVTCSCCVTENGAETWENIIGICLEHEGDSSDNFLLVHQNINEMKQREMKAKSQIADMNRKERQYQLALTANAFAAYEFNVSRDLLENDVVLMVDGKPASLLASRGLPLPCSATDFLASWHSVILPESLADYTAKANVPWLRKRFYEGIQEVELDFWIQDAYGHEQCIRQSFYMASNDLTGDVMALTVMRDITAQVVKQRAQTKALQDALMLAQHANEAKTTFLSNMSHDIRTPMNAIIGFATIASGHLDNTNQVRECLRKVLSSSNHLLSLINDILDMSRIESGKLQIKEQPCNISELMHNVLTIIQPQVKAKQMKLMFDTFDVVNEDVYADPLKLNQVFINLLGNAVKYTPSGGEITFRITQKPAFRHGYADYVFQVGDNGIGMDADFVEHIFEPFTRATTTTQSGIQGTGLGMAITRNIVEMMNGHIEVESALGKGSLFTVSLTLKLQDGAAATFDMEALADAKVLIVDDDFHVCDSVSKMLRTLGMKPEWTTSGREGVYRAQAAKADGEPFRAFIVDWQMPGINGMETARKLRGISGPDVPLIILTAYEWAEIEDDAKSIGVSAFCAKPLFISDLKNALFASIARKEKEEDDTPEVRFNNARILLVDDVEMNREVAEFILTESGFQVETAPDGTDAVSMVSESPENYYDAILMDVQMPTMDGYEATRTIRSLERQDVKTLPILAMTANALEEDKANALKAGMNDHIAKPIDIELFFEILGKYFQKSQHGDEAPKEKGN